MRPFVIFIACLASATGVNPRSLAADDTPAGEPESEASQDDLEDLDLEELLATPTVEAASRRKQSLHDAPSTVSLITARDIEASPATHVAELLRRVPGVFVLQSDPNFYSVNLRGLARLANNRVPVLLDGQPLADRTQGYVSWGSLPVNPNDIDYIEVIRGAGSTFYGADALGGVVEIVTRRPLDDPGTRATAWGQLDLLADNPQSADGMLWIGSGGGAYGSQTWTNTARSFGARLSLGTNMHPEGPAVRREHFRGPTQASAALAFDLRPSPDLALYSSLTFGYAEPLMATEDVMVLQLLAAISQAGFLIKLEHERFLIDNLRASLQVDGRLLGTHSRPVHFEVGSWSFGSAEDNISSREIHGLLTLNLSLFEGRNLVTLGCEGTVSTIQGIPTGPWWAAGGLVLQNETRLLADESLILNLAGRLEYIHAEADRMFGPVTHRPLSPRFSVIWKFLPEHSLRITAASAFRTPTPYEAFADQQEQPADPEAPPIHLMIGNPGLRPEQVFMLEAGYRGLLLKQLRLELVAFGQRTEDRILYARRNQLPTLAVNGPAIDQLGLELGLRYAPSPAFAGSFSYALLIGWETGGARFGDWPAHLYNLGAEVRLPWHLRLTADATLVFDYRPTLPILANTDQGLPMAEWRAIQAADQALVDLRLGRLLLEDRVEVFLAIKNLVSFFREPAGLRMIPHPLMQPIGGTVLLGLRACLSPVGG